MDIPAPQRFEAFSEEQIRHAIEGAAAAFPKWRATSIAQRAALMHRVADLMESRAERLGRLITAEMGKPLASAVEEVRKCARGCVFYAEHAAEFLAEEHADGPAARNAVRFEPLGPVLAVMPWNFPFCRSSVSQLRL